MAKSRPKHYWNVQLETVMKARNSGKELGQVKKQSADAFFKARGGMTI